MSPVKGLQKAPVSQVCSVGTPVASVYCCWPLASPAQPVGSLAMLVLVAPAGMKDPPEESLGTGGAVCLRVCEHTSITTRRQPQLLVQAPASFLLLNCHFPATLKGPLAPAHPAGTRLSLLRHASMFPHQFGGKNSTS